jgi:hypothetical protein
VKQLLYIPKIKKKTGQKFNKNVGRGIDKMEEKCFIMVSSGEKW